MKIETKFNINDFAVRKFDNQLKNHIQLFEIMNVLTETCSAGTQVFYLCRTIIAEKEYEHTYKQEGEYNWRIAHYINSAHDNSLGWKKYREDELIEPKKEDIKVILNAGEGKD